MNKAQMSGTVAWTLGTVQMHVGRLVRNRRVESSGFNRRIAGSARRAIGDAQSVIKRCIKSTFSTF